MANEDFTLHFEIPNYTKTSASIEPIELERAFAQEQIATLLQYVALYEDGRPLHPDAFSIVNAPGTLHPFVADAMHAERVDDA